MNILVTLNKKYLNFLKTLLRSIAESNNHNFDIYVASNDVSQRDITKLENEFREKFIFHLIYVDDYLLEGAPTTKRYPFAMYYRLFAFKFLPDNVDKVLYLDPDIIVLKDLESLYNTSFDDKLFVAASNVGEVLRKFNEIKNAAPRGAEYVNTGVLLMNIKELRKIQKSDEIINYIKKYKNRLMLPDQDVLSGLYGDKIKKVPNIIYNLNDRGIIFYNLNPKNVEKINIDWVNNNTVILHFYGKNKPWLSNYHGILKEFYDKFNY